MKSLLALVIGLLSLSANASSGSDRRELGSHLHGSGNLNIVIEGRVVAMVLEAPGADIVGFEHTATSKADRAAVDAAVAALEKPLELFVFPSQAGCIVSSAEARSIRNDGKRDHGHADHHSEFHAKYLLECADPDAIERIEFGYFRRFPGARELDVQLISGEGANAFEVEREKPALDL